MTPSRPPKMNILTVALVRARRGDPPGRLTKPATGGVRTYATFLGLTLTNPVTVTYFCRSACLMIK